LEYPGRGNRAGESLLTNADILADDLYHQVATIISNNEHYAIFGHSMGGLMSYLLTRKIKLRRHPLPLHLFITGTAGPFALTRGHRKVHLLNKLEFIEEIKSLNGCPPEILQNNELLNYFEPILRADFATTENYVYTNHAPFNIPMTVITGREEDLAWDDVQSWQRETVLPVDFRYIQGDHFFIFKDPEAVVEIIIQKIKSYFKSFRYE